MNKELQQVSRVTKDKFSWNIEKFSSLLMNTGEFVRSSVVKNSDFHWCLKLYPNGRIFPNQIQVNLETVGFASLPSGVEYKIGFRDIFGDISYKFPVTIPKYAEKGNKFKSSGCSESNLKSFQSTLSTDASSTDKAVTSSTIKSSSLCSNTTSDFATGVFTTMSLSAYCLSFPKTTAAQVLHENWPASASTTADDRKADVSRLLSQSAVSGTEKDTNHARNKTSDSTWSFPGSISSFDTLSKANETESQPRFLPSNISTKAASYCFFGDNKKCVPSNTSSQLFFEAIQGAHVPRNCLFGDKDKLLPDDVLTVICEMKVTTVVHFSESSGVNEDASAVGSKLLTKNLEDAFENPRFSDVTLKVGDAEFPAHKIILANRSKVFDGMFCSGMKESQENVVNLVEMKPSTAESMLRYIYTGKIEELSMDRATDLYVAADRYDMPELKQWCKDFILRHISPDTVCDVAVLSKLHGDDDLEKATKRIIRNNLKTVLNSEKWLSFSKDNPAFYLEMLQVALLDGIN